MPTDLNPVVRTSDRLWSEEVGIADPSPVNSLETTWVYEFGNGRRFTSAIPTPPEEQPT